MKYFTKLTREEKLEMIEAQLDGKTIEFWDGQGWLRTLSGESLIYYSDVRYRVAETKDEFTNWDILPEEYKWIARDKSGIAYAYNNKPILECGLWDCDDDKDDDEDDDYYSTMHHVIRVSSLTCYKQGTVNWKDSLIKRPE